MGDRFRKAQIGNQRRGREKAAREAREPRLIERPEVTKTIYYVLPDDGKECIVGENLRVLLPDPNGSVVVARDHERIGVIEGEGGNVLKTALAEPTGPGIGDIRILGFEDITGEAKAEMLGAPTQ